MKELAHRILELDERIKENEAEITALFRTDDRAGIIESLPGICPVLGAEFLAIVGDLSAHKDAVHLAAHAGLAPVPRDSGRKTGNLHRPGTGLTAWVQVGAEEVLIGADDARVVREAQRLLGRGGARRAERVVVQREQGNHRHRPLGALPQRVGVLRRTTPSSCGRLCRAQRLRAVIVDRPLTEHVVTEARSK
ncbi:hypothetical protein GCM10010383_73160 [Streptomyces lomondensis]|uniref:Transposase IS116/IS110/IS902 C-terminal domain-containing protein n=1 Tax=Streptomyces lomondensis TaxID=68229 RepID=A0ABQ2XTJ4_9ACTN|nr:hypothetical protein GCM10010383_73160 [Streptomyces lomondensis]